MENRKSYTSPRTDILFADVYDVISTSTAGNQLPWSTKGGKSND